MASPIARKTFQPSPLREDEDLESDEVDEEEEEELSGLVPQLSDNPSDSESTSSQRQRLPINLQRQLLIDIQSKGGIDKFGLDSQQSLANLCDQRPLLYGPRGDKLRGRIGKKVIRWRGLYRDDPTKWLSVLAKLSVAEKPTGPSKAKKQRGASKQVAPPASQDSEEDNQSKEDRKLPASSKGQSQRSIPASVSIVSGPLSVQSLTSVASKKTAAMSTASNTRKSPSVFDMLLCSVHC